MKSTGDGRRKEVVVVDAAQRSGGIGKGAEKTKGL